MSPIFAFDGSNEFDFDFDDLDIPWPEAKVGAAPVNIMSRNYVNTRTAKDANISLVGTENLDLEIRGVTETDKRIAEEQLASIRRLQSNPAGHEDSEETWTSAAWWVAVEPNPEEVAEILPSYGYQLAPEGCCQWSTRPAELEPQLTLEVRDIQQKAGHTWYIVNCQFSHARMFGNDSESVTVARWMAPRRMWQLRNWLHNPIKGKLSDIYPKCFRDSPFARHGVHRPSSQQRLQAWFASLCYMINSQEAPPWAVALTVEFLQAPRHTPISRVPTMIPEDWA
jgi:hypothetical protein